ncbi:MAG: amidase [Pseudomonadales bacterium]|nr:amidase [Pseudomonadales bacterium]
MTTSELAFSSASDLASLIRKREISSVELLNLYFDRVDQYNPALNAIILQIRDQALQQAEFCDAELARGAETGPLHGVPITTKESFAIQGLPCCWGIPELASELSTEDALAVQRLKQAGAVVFGKTNIPIRLADFQSYNEVYGCTNNPWDHSRAPGGSSGGAAAAVASGMTGFEIGSDIGGSIRNPAHYCGVFGHKPTWDLLPMRGHSLGDILTPTDISVIGPLARSARDLKMGVHILAGPDEIMAGGYALKLKPLSKPISELSVAVWKDDAIAPVDQETIQRVDKVAQIFDQAGAKISYHARPDFSAEHCLAVYQFLLQSAMAARMPDADYAKVQAYARTLPRADTSAGANLVRAQTASLRDWAAMNEARTQMRWAWHSFFQSYDILLTPQTATAAFKHDHGPMGKRSLNVDGEQRPYFEQIFWAGLSGASYLPSTVVPTGPNSAGLPIGVQIIGAEYADLTTIMCAEFLEENGCHFVPPPDYIT